MKNYPRTASATAAHESHSQDGKVLVGNPPQWLEDYVARRIKELRKKVR